MTIRVGNGIKHESGFRSIRAVIEGLSNRPPVRPGQIVLHPLLNGVCGVVLSAEDIILWTDSLEFLGTPTTIEIRALLAELNQKTDFLRVHVPVLWSDEAITWEEKLSLAPYTQGNLSVSPEQFYHRKPIGYLMECKLDLPGGTPLSRNVQVDPFPTDKQRQEQACTLFVGEYDTLPTSIVELGPLYEDDSEALRHAPYQAYKKFGDPYKDSGRFHLEGLRQPLEVDVRCSNEGFGIETIFSYDLIYRNQSVNLSAKHCPAYGKVTAPFALWLFAHVLRTGESDPSVVINRYDIDRLFQKNELAALIHWEPFLATEALKTIHSGSVLHGLLCRIADSYAKRTS